MLSVLGVAAACTNIAKIEGVIDAPSSEVVVKLLDMNRYSVLDTVATDAEGRFAYKVDIEKGQPEFVYIFHKDTKVASLLLEAGDEIPEVTVIEKDGEFYLASGLESALAYSFNMETFIPARLVSGDTDGKVYTKMKNSL